MARRTHNDPEYFDEFQGRLAKAISDSGKTPNELCEAYRDTRNVDQELEASARHSVGFIRLLILAPALGVSLDWLAGLEEPKRVKELRS